MKVPFFPLATFLWITDYSDLTILTDLTTEEVWGPPTFDAFSISNY